MGIRSGFGAARYMPIGFYGSARLGKRGSKGWLSRLDICVTRDFLSCFQEFHVTCRYP